MSIREHLTNPADPETQRQHNATVGGMAYFAHTGPPDTTCRTCDNWGAGKTRFKRSGGDLVPSRCSTYTRLMDGMLGPGVPHDTPSCRHYSMRHPDKTPPIVPLTRKEIAARRKAT